ncbi:MAG: hypothetical protein DI543_00845 [Bradyrhizobium icense]|nr:MAG: hypothetical protein DI543_00845 [Bradyrhizobium icense]
MPGLDPGIHVLSRSKRNVDGRDRPGHRAKQSRGELPWERSRPSGSTRRKRAPPPRWHSSTKPS